jgi:MFS family permease
MVDDQAVHGKAIYSRIFSVKGTKSFCASAAVARIPMSMLSFGIVLAINSVYGDWASAGTVSAVYVLSQAVMTPVYARLYDRHGQQKVGRVVLPFSILTLLIFALGVFFKIPVGFLYLLAIVMGLTQFSFGALVRTRWTSTLKSSGLPHNPYLPTAFSLEAAVDELIFIIGPVFATFLATQVQSVAPLVASLIALSVGGTVFFSLRSARASTIIIQEVGAEGSAGPAGLERHVGSHDASTTVGDATDVEKVEMTESRKKVKTALAFGGVVLLMVCFLAYNMSFSAYDVTLVAMTKAQGREWMAGLILAVISVGSCAGALFFGSHQWKGSGWRRLAILLAIQIVGNFGFFLAWGNIPVLLVIEVVTGFFVAPTFATGSLLIERIVPGLFLTEGLSWLQVGNAIGTSFGSTVTGILIDKYGFVAGFHATYISVIVATLIVLCFGIKYLKRGRAANSFPQA